MIRAKNYETVLSKLCQKCCGLYYNGRFYELYPFMNDS